jgi:hypothetical protein
MADRRYTRQTRLAEVGEAGQLRLSKAPLALATSGEAAWIERRYLEAAGATVREAAGERPAPALPFAVRDPAARDVAAGAHAALAALRSVWLGGPAKEPG